MLHSLVTGAVVLLSLSQAAVDTLLLSPVLCSSPTLQLTADRVTELPRPEPPGVRGAGAGLSSPVITVSVTSSH